ncbi:MAG TPA: MFS transporter, partial [Cyclobacteriaceae bacterium]|nr:MFS transporter [Cyclobacteriaceae bacterium]
ILIGGSIAAISLLALTALGEISQFTGISLLAIAIIVALTLDLSINISFNPTRSIIADVTPEGEKRTKGYTWMQTISGMFGVMAYAIGAYFGNYSLIYFGILLVFLFSIIPPFFITEPRLISSTDSLENQNSTTKSQQGQLYRIYLAHGFCWLGIQTMFVYMFFYVKESMGIASDAEAGQVVSLSFLVLNTVGFILPATVLEPLAKKIGRVKVHVVAIGLMAVGYFLITLFGSSITLVYVFMAVAGIGWAATVSLPFAIMTEKVDKAKMGLFMGIFNLSVVIPQLIVSLGFGSYIQHAENKNVIFIICTVCLAISTFLWSLVKEHAVIMESTETQSQTSH